MNFAPRKFSIGLMGFFSISPAGAPEEKLL